MRLSGKFRYGFAMLLVGFTVLALAIGGWLFFGTHNNALLQAASGTVSAATHLNDLLQLQWAVLIGVTALVLKMRVAADERFARVEVTDTGVGIPYEDQPNVFKKFFRASNAALMQPNASGVGLFATKTLVEAMGGTIDFKSEEGKGTTFWFTVPKLLVSDLPISKPSKRR